MVSAKQPAGGKNTGKAASKPAAAAKTTKAAPAKEKEQKAPAKAAPPAEKPAAPKPAPTPAAQPPKPKTATSVATAKAKKPQKTVVQKKKSLKKKKQSYQFTIECKNPVEDGILKTGAFEDFLKEKIKFKGKTGNLSQGGITVSSTKNTVTVNSDSEFSKRYLKFLVKKYLKRNSLRDWIRVVASDKNSYELRYFQINEQGEEEAE